MASKRCAGGMIVAQDDGGQSPRELVGRAAEPKHDPADDERQGHREQQQ
jgi:hypothetical protein